MTHRQNGLLAFRQRDNGLLLYQQFIQIERLFSAGGWEDVRHHDEPHRRCEPESAQWHHPQEGIEERDEQATKRALRDEQVPWVTVPAWLTNPAGTKLGAASTPPDSLS